ncbi:flavodoxin-dependent (E)-4-hydroxy-3-methylbut-2-enyl-diphosphate synthase [Collinsella intestinalis]|uniref:flavodoxin-dependent (E)-4-hydroxy-3-methylbut-2-enyl-diphosphate synthase n=1 Tax=Collinsella intestinalis TaxID=147207 RepID=UPI00195BC4B3|nr:flavodoxin-dependent (E)-4-hydroxy-3-methylbut-2-enyl-diphosphate synthase [Collinsella intestinalis]MBM6682554.1 flavodoxin-dependent (E)-4-hydroxy-3-methylbut-2-enyl-diphosphate synthase [Collinsella intestinalis]
MADTLPREKTRPVRVGSVTIGGGAPVVVQSMTSTDTADAAATLEQVRALAAAGCDLVRVSVPTREAVEGFREVCAASPVPIVADIHFDYRLALAALEAGAAKLRINPGNIGSWDKVDAVIDAAGEAGAAIRIGVNAGSLEDDIASREELTLPEKLVLSSERFVEHFEARGFTDIVLSAKAHDVRTTIDTYRALSRELPQVPLHLGVTEAGTVRQGTIKSSVGLGVLLAEGIGDTLRVSLTADPVEEPPVAWGILECLGIRRRGPELVSCPTCGRTQVDLIGLAEEVERRLTGVTKPISVAVMGCVVNGPGEASGADVGVACGRGCGLIFKHGEVVRKVPEDRIVDELMAEIDRL